MYVYKLMAKIENLPTRPNRIKSGIASDLSNPNPDRESSCFCDSPAGIEGFEGENQQDSGANIEFIGEDEMEEEAVCGHVHVMPSSSSHHSLFVTLWPQAGLKCRQRSCPKCGRWRHN